MLNHLSVSSIKRYQECPKRWAAEKFDGVASRWGSALVKGRAIDILATSNWLQKADSHRDLPLPEAQDIAENAFRSTVDEAGGRRSIDWRGTSYARALDSTLDMAAVHMRHHAPLYTPAGVQVEFRKSVEGGFDVLGVIDAIDHDGTLLDIKTSRTRLSQRDADIDLQATGYTWGVSRPAEFRWLRVIDTGARVSSEVVISRRSQAAIDWFEVLVRDISTLIRAGAFPARPGWQCSSCALVDACVGTFAAQTAES